MRKILLLLLIAVPAAAQSTSGAGFPPYACSANYLNQSYRDTDNNLSYKCANIPNIGYLWQPVNPSIFPVVSAPAGSCTNGLPGQQVISTGVQYSCQNGTWAAIGGGGILPNPASSAFLDEGGAVFNPKAYGAKGDGTTNDCTAITNTIAAAVAAGSGHVKFGQGNYFVGNACHISVSAPVTIEGVASCGAIADGACASRITSSDTTGTLFTFTSYALLRNIAIVNSATATAGAAVLASGANANRGVSFEGVNISGFWDNIDLTTGVAWHMSDSIVQSPLRYGMWISDNASPDAGDWGIVNSVFGCNVVTSLACLRITGQDGGRITSNKFNSSGTADGIQVDCTGIACLNELSIVNNSIYSSGGGTPSGIPVHVVNGNGLIRMVIASNDIYAAGNTSLISPVTITNVGSVYIGGGVIDSDHTNVPLISQTSTQDSIIMPYAHTHLNTTANSLTSCTNDCFDYSAMALGNVVASAVTGSTVTGNGSFPQVVATSGTHAIIRIVGGANNQNSAIQHYEGATALWRTGLIGDSTNNYNLFDEVSSKSVVKFPSNTMPASSITGNSAGVSFNVYTVSTLPSCGSSQRGAVTSVSDATAPTYLGTLTGGGSVYTPVSCNGTAWVSY